MPEGESTVLNNSCLVFMSNMWSGSHHDSTKVPVLTAGTLGGTLETGRVLDAVIAQSEAQAQNMWKIREGVAEAGRADGPAVSYDISVSISKIPEFIDKGIKAALEIKGYDVGDPVPPQPKLGAKERDIIAASLSDVEELVAVF